LVSASQLRVLFSPRQRTGAQTFGVRTTQSLIFKAVAIQDEIAQAIAVALKFETLPAGRP
jgi:hypothetical protein